MTIRKALDFRDDVDRLYVSRKEGIRGHANTGDHVDESIPQIQDYIELQEVGMIIGSRNYTDNTIAKRMTITRKQKWEENNSMGVLND